MSWNMKQISYYIINFESLTWTVEVFRTRFRCPSLLDFLRNLFLKKYKIWVKCAMSSDAITLNFSKELNFTDWLSHTGFGEIRFLKWRDVVNSNSWFLAIWKEFSEGLPLFKLKRILTKIDISWVKSSTGCYTHPPTCISLMQTMWRFDLSDL